MSFEIDIFGFEILEPYNSKCLFSFLLMDKMWSTGEENGKPLQYSCLESPMNNTKKQKDRTLQDELLRLVGVQNATGDQWRNNYSKNEETQPK